MGTVGNPLQTYGSGKFGNPPVENLGVGYYLALLTSEYRNAPKLNAFLQAMLQKFQDICQCQVSLDTAFDVDSAIGAQLDVIGIIVGANRTVPFQPSGGVSPILDDATYRILLKATAGINQWDGKIDSLYPLWQTLFPGGQIIIADGQNMTATILLPGSGWGSGGWGGGGGWGGTAGFTSIEQDLIKNGMIVPRPEGVLYLFVFPPFPVFAFDENNQYEAGFDTGNWAVGF